MEPTDSQLDARLRTAARRVVDRAILGVDVEADLAHVRDLAGTSAQSELDRAGRFDRARLAVLAAAVMLVVVGVVAMVTTGDDDQIEVTGPSSTVGIATTVAAPTTSAVTSPAVDSTLPTTTAAFERQPEPAIAEPAVATPMQLITITPSEPVVYCFLSQISIGAPDDSAVRQVGLINPDGSFTMTSTPAATCDDAPPLDAPITFRAPADLAAGDYVACLSGLDDPAGCAPLTIRTWPEECFTAPIAPPGLVDGSAPGEPSISADGTTATWGTGRVAISQVVGERPDPSWVSPAALTAPGQLEVLQSSGTAANVLSIMGSPAICPRRYTLSADLYQPELRVLVGGWLQFFADGTPVPNDRHDELLSPVDYFGVRYVVDDGASSSVVHRFAPDGSDLGPVDADELVTPLPGVELDDRRRVRFDPDTSTDGACQNRPLLISDAPLHPELTEAMSFAATPSGLVVATRHVCPDGTWGPSSFAQTVLLDLANPGAGIRVLSEDPQQLGGLSPRSVRWISPDSRLLVFGEPRNAENSTLSMVTLADPATALALPSGCPTPGNLASLPVIVGDAMMVARACPGGATAAVTIDQLGLDDLSLRWTATIDRELLAYCSCVGISAIDAEVPAVIVTGSASVEVPNTSILVVGDQQTDITHLGFPTLAFTTTELLPIAP